MKKIITSILDTDLYKLSMQNAVLELFPNTVVEYRFKNRGDQRFSTSFLTELKKQISFMSTISLSNKECSWIKENIPFFKPSYIEYLKNYRFKPEEVNVSLNDDNDLILDVKGPWSSAIFWEVPLMALISELYFKMINTDWIKPHSSYGMLLENQKVLAYTKRKELTKNNCYFADFGTRRRRSFEMQNIFINEMTNEYFDTPLENFVGTSNVYFAMKHNIKPIGTMAHEFIMGVSALESLRHANYYALQNWVRVYNADLGIALTDTFGTPAFFSNFNMRLAKLYDGVRHDSGDPIKFGDKIIAHYESLGIDPKSKIIVFSDGLNVENAIQIQKYFKGKIKVSFGIGTNFTNDFEGSPALNMVIKLWSCNGIPVVKLSDVDGKVMGDPDAVRVAKFTFNNTPLDS